MIAVTTRNRWLLVAVIFVLIVAAVSTAVLLPRRAASQRNSLAREAATGVVSAAARRDSIELESWFGRPVSDGEASRLAQLIPDNIGEDSTRYQTPFLNPSGEGSVTVEVQNPATARFAVLVSMTWDADADRWRVTDLERVVAK